MSSHTEPSDASGWRRDLWVDAEGIEQRGGARDAFYDLSVAEKSLVIACVLIETGIFAGQKTIGFQRMIRGLRALSLPIRVRSFIAKRVLDDEASALRMARLHLIAHEITPLDFDCVTSSASLWWYLRSLGLSPELHVGVRSFGGVFNAHAWITLDNTVLNDIRGEHRDYRELPGSVIDQ